MGSAQADKSLSTNDYMVQCEGFENSYGTLSTENLEAQHIFVRMVERLPPACVNNIMSWRNSEDMNLYAHIYCDLSNRDAGYVETFWNKDNATCVDGGQVNDPSEWDIKIKYDALLKHQKELVLSRVSNKAAKCYYAAERSDVIYYNDASNSAQVHPTTIFTSYQGSKTIRLKNREASGPRPCFRWLIGCEIPWKSAYDLPNFDPASVEDASDIQHFEVVNKCVQAHSDVDAVFREIVYGPLPTSDRA